MFNSRVKSEFKILDFDIECRPLSWYAGDFNTKEITAIAAAFIEPKWSSKPTTVECWLLGVHSPEEIIDGFLKMYNEAGMVTGHFIRGFDLPLINSGVMEYGLPPLEPKLTQDTKNDLVKRHGMSNSQENLADALGIDSPKIGMSQEDWRAANRLTPEGIEKTKRRVIGDVIQHIEMREEMLVRGMLGKPKVWRPERGGLS